MLLMIARSSETTSLEGNVRHEDTIGGRDSIEDVFFFLREAFPALSYFLPVGFRLIKPKSGGVGVAWS